MKKEIFDNGVRFLYKYKEGSHSSFCIALEAGANFEDEHNIGCAHALEHILFKGTKKYSEEVINFKLDEIFAMNNAMTNFPYVIFYGVCSNNDFREGFNLYSDIILNPAFKEDGFCEEMSVIKEESREWKEDLEQHCEDLLLKNAFQNERIQNLIIGDEIHIEKINIEKLKAFYDKHYVSENMVISYVGSLQFEEVKEIVKNNFDSLVKKEFIKNEIERKTLKEQTYIVEGFSKDASKIQRAFDISELTLEQIAKLKIFNMYFGEGVSSILYDEIRTKRGLAYEVYSEVKWEKGIRIFKIVVNTSKKNRKLVLDVLDEICNSINDIVQDLDNLKIKTLIKRYKLKVSLELERSIVISNRTAIYEILYNEYNMPIKEVEYDKDITVQDLTMIINKVFKNSVTMILE